jgi:hypothetical protein
MKNKKMWGFAALAGLFLAGSLMRSPQSQATGATYSSPVTLVNTTANPGSVLDANVATRVPYQSSVSSSCAGIDCAFQFSLVPLGFRLVVEYVGANLTVPVTGNNNPPVGTLSYIPGFGGNSLWQTFVSSSFGPVILSGNFETVVIGQQVREYIDPGTPTLHVSSPNMAGAVGLATLSGYLQNCSVSPCPSQQN